MCTVAIALFGLVSLSRLKLNLLPGPLLPDAHDPHRAARGGAARARDAGDATGRGGGQHHPQRAPGALRVARRPVRRDARVRLGHRHGRRRHRRAREARRRCSCRSRRSARSCCASTPRASRSCASRSSTADAARTDGGIERLKTLRRFADDRLKPDLEAVEGSAAVKVSGGYEDEIQVFVDQQKLAQMGLSIDAVTRRIRAENVNLSGGRLEQGTQRFLVRTLNEFESIEQMAGAIIATRDGQPVYLRDVATGDARLQGPRGDHPRRRSRGHRARRLQGRRCQHRAARGGRAQATRGAQRVAAARAREIRPVYDQSKFISAAIGEVKSAALIGGLLAILVLYAFLRDARATLITGIAIPGVGARHLRAHVRVRPDAQHHVARRHRARRRHAGGQRGGGAREHRAQARARDGPARRGPARHARSGHRRHGIDPHLGRRVLPDGLHQRRRRAALQGPVAHRHLRAVVLAGGRAHPRADARGGTAANAADAARGAARPRDRRAASIAQSARWPPARAGSAAGSRAARASH